MYEYIKGKITATEANYIVLENNGIGYSIFISNPSFFKIGVEYTLYIYQYVREDEISLYGFSTTNEKQLFLKLIDVKGLGCKMALPLLSSSSQNIIDAIEKEDINYLKKFPKIGDKVARQIILDLKGKLVVCNANDSSLTDCDELVDTLKSLGYKTVDIKNVLPNIKKDISLEKQIKEALRLLLK